VLYLLSYGFSVRQSEQGSFRVVQM